MTSIASSLATLRSDRGRPRDGQGAGPQDHGPARLERDRVLEVGRGRTIPGADGPAVRIHGDLRPSEIEHRLDRQDHSRLKPAPPTRRPIVGDLRLLVESGPDAMTDKVSNDTIT